MKNTRKILSAFLALVMALSCFAVMSVSAAPAANKNEVSVYSGNPATDWTTEDNGNTIIISTADQLMGFAAQTQTDAFTGKTVKLATDVIINKGDASKWTKDTQGLEDWICSNEWGYAFNGNFDGQGHVISGLYAKDGEKNNAFFSFLRPSANRTISNVNIVNSYFYSEKGDNAAIVGYLQPTEANITLSIDNVYVDASVVSGAAADASGNAFVGGFVGCIASSVVFTLNIENSRFDGLVKGVGKCVGGLVASTTNKLSVLNVTNCEVNAEVIGDGYVGGIVGFNESPIIVDGCSFDGSVRLPNSITSAGGIVGVVSAQTQVKNCSVNATISGKGKLGGIVGDTYNTTEINNCSVKGAVNAANELAGGLVGIATKTSVTCNNCSVDANLSAGNTAWAARVGMLVARLRSSNISAENCIVRGKITASATNVAGLVGEISDEDAKGATKTLSVSIKNVLMSVEKNALEALVITTDSDRIDATDTIAFTLSNIVYDSTVLNVGNLDAVKLNVTCNTTGLDGFTATAKTTEDLKGANGAALFTGWTAVDGDYPTPVSNNAGSANVPHIDNIQAYKNYGKSSVIFGYQHSYDNDVANEGGETYKFRLIATMNGENYKAAGFKNISVIYKDANGEQVGETLTQEVYYCNYIYESVKGGGKTYTADGYLCDNIFCLTIGNIPADVTTIEITATPFVAENDANVIDGEVASFTADIH